MTLVHPVTSQETPQSWQSGRPAFTMMQVQLSVDAALILGDLVQSGAGNTSSEVIERLLTSILPQFRSQHAIINGLTAELAALHQATRVQHEQMISLQKELIYYKTQLSPPGSGVNPVNRVVNGALSLPTAASVHSASPQGWPTQVTAGNGTASSHDAERFCGGRSDDTVSEETRAAEGSDGMSDEEILAEGSKTRRRFFKSIYELDPSSRRKRKAKFCRALVGLMELYGMDAPYVATVVQEMANDESVLRKHQQKRAVLVEELKTGKPSALARSLVAAPVCEEALQIKEPVAPSRTSSRRRSTKDADMADTAALVVTPAISGMKRNREGNPMAVAERQVLAATIPKASVANPEPHAVMEPASTTQQPQQHDDTPTVARPIMCDSEWGIMLDQLHPVNHDAFNKAVTDPGNADGRVSALSMLTTANKSNNNAPDVWRVLSPTQPHLFSSMGGLPIPSPPFGVKAPHTLQDELEEEHGGVEGPHPSPGPSSSLSLSALSALGPGCRTLLPSWRDDDNEHAFGPDFGFDFGLFPEA